MSGIVFGWGKNKVEFGVASVPNRKRKFLYTVRGCMVERLAYFTSDENADIFQNILDEIIDVAEGKKKLIK